MKYIEIRNMDAAQLRGLCIKNSWYTRGTCAQYNTLFDRLYDECGCPVNLTTEKLAEIANDIMEHSEIVDYTITTVMYELAKYSTTYFEEA